MNKLTINILFLITVFSIPKYAFPQWNEKSVAVRFSLPEVALIDIEPSFDNCICFDIKPTTESGATPEIEESSQNSIWINYTSSARAMEAKRAITAEITNGIIPKGYSLYLEASDYFGTGKGKLGVPEGKILLGNNPKKLISGVGNCYTGDGINNGHKLNFSLKITDYSALKSNEEIVFTILYTLTDN